MALSYQQKIQYIKEFITQDERQIKQKKRLDIIIQKDLIESNLNNQDGFSEVEKQTFQNFMFLKFQAFKLVDVNTKKELPFILSESGIILKPISDFKIYEDENSEDDYYITKNPIEPNSVFFILPTLTDNFMKNINKANALLNGSVPVQSQKHLWSLFMNIFGQSGIDSVYIELLISQMMRSKTNSSIRYRNDPMQIKNNQFVIKGIKSITTVEDPELAMQFENVEKNLFQALATKQPKNENNPLAAIYEPEKLVTDSGDGQEEVKL